MASPPPPPAPPGSLRRVSSGPSPAGGPPPGEAPGDLPPPEWPDAPAQAGAPPRPPSPPSPPGSGGGGGGRGRRGLLIGLAALAVVAIGGLALFAASGVLSEGMSTATEEPVEARAPGPDEEPPGTDPELDALWLACAAEDWAACDDLFFQSDFGSAYEDFGATCGNRLQDAGLCVDEFQYGGVAGRDELPPSGPDTPPPGTDPELDALWDACAGEDWQACDELYLEADVNSEYEVFGDTCGYRTLDAFTCLDEYGGDATAAPAAPGDPRAPNEDPELDALWDACAAEDWEACDRLYFQSELDSDYEFFGATCGTRDLLTGASELCQNLHGDPDDPPVILLDDLAAGMCFDEPAVDEIVYWIQTVPCEDLHDIEIMGLIELTVTSFPEEISGLAFERCRPIFAAFVGLPYPDSVLDIYHLSPTRDSWELGDRGIACGVYDPAGPVEGTLEGAAR